MTTEPHSDQGKRAVVETSWDPEPGEVLGDYRRRLEQTVDEALRRFMTWEECEGHFYVEKDDEREAENGWKVVRPMRRRLHVSGGAKGGVGIYIDVDDLDQPDEENRSVAGLILSPVEALALMEHLAKCLRRSSVETDEERAE